MNSPLTYDLYIRRTIQSVTRFLYVDTYVTLNDAANALHRHYWLDALVIDSDYRKYKLVEFERFDEELGQDVMEFSFELSRNTE